MCTRGFTTRAARLLTASLFAAGIVLSPNQSTPAMAATSSCGPITSTTHVNISDQASHKLGTIGELPPDPGEPYWDGADRANDNAYVGNGNIAVGGYFKQYVTPAGVKQSANGLAIVSLTTGQLLRAWNVSGTINTLKATPDCSKLYVGGDFDAIDGVPRTNAAKIDLSTGQVMAWNPSPNGTVEDIDLYRSQVLLGGEFTSLGGIARAYAASVSAGGGTVTDWLRLNIRRPVDGPELVFNVVTSPDQSLVALTGNFSRVNGHSHFRMFLVKTSRSGAKLTRWATLWTHKPCSPNKTHEELGLAWAPTSKAFYTASTGGGPGSGGKTDCDAATKWPARNLSNRKVNPIWVNYTDTDSLSGVAVAGSRPYFAGHNRWCSKTPGRPVQPVDRPGLCALNSRTGKVTAFKPVTSRQRSMHVRMNYVPGYGLVYTGDVNKIGDANGDNKADQPRNDLALFPVVG